MSSGLAVALKGRRLRGVLVLTTAVLMALALSLPQVKADVYLWSAPPDLQSQGFGKYESGEQVSWWNGAGGVGKIKNTESNCPETEVIVLSAFGGSFPPVARDVYSYAGFYKDVYIPSDAVAVKVTATITIVPWYPPPYTRKAYGADFTAYRTDNDQVGVWFKADIDKTPPTKEWTGYYDTLLYAMWATAQYGYVIGKNVVKFNADRPAWGWYTGTSITASVSIPNPPSGWHKVYFGLVGWIHTEHWWASGVELGLWYLDARLKIKSVEITIVRKTSLTVSLDKSVASPNEPVTISGRLTTLNGQGLAGQTIYLGYYGSPYNPIGPTTTKQYGYYDYRWNAPPNSGTYMVEARFYGTSDLLSSTVTTILMVSNLRTSSWCRAF